MDESSKVVTFKKPLEIEDLEISMNQEQSEDTIPFQRQENWENEILEEYRTPLPGHGHVEFKDIKKEDFSEELKESFFVFQEQSCDQLQEQREFFKQELSSLHEQVNVVYSNMNLMENGIHEQICDLNSELKEIKEKESDSSKLKKEKFCQTTNFFKNEPQVTLTPKITSTRMLQKQFQEIGKSSLSSIAQETSQAKITNKINSSMETNAGSTEAACSENETSREDNNTEKSGTVKMKPQHYDGSDDWEEYLTQFEILAEINKWNDVTKVLYLAGSLKGPARTILNELKATERRRFQSLVTALENRFGSVNRAEMYRAKLQSKMKSRDESIPELGQAIRKMTRQAYPNADSNLRDVLALDHFIDALPDPDMKYRHKESRPRNITDAEILAVRLETHKLADRQRHHSFVRTLESDDKFHVQNRRLPPLRSTPLRSSGSNHQNWTGKYKEQNQRTQRKMEETFSDEMKKIHVRQDLANLTVDFHKNKVSSGSRQSSHAKNERNESEHNSGNASWSNLWAGARSKPTSPKL